MACGKGGDPGCFRPHRSCLILLRPSRFTLRCDTLRHGGKIRGMPRERDGNAARKVGDETPAPLCLATKVGFHFA